MEDVSRSRVSAAAWPRPRLVSPDSTDCCRYAGQRRRDQSFTDSLERAQHEVAFALSPGTSLVGPRAQQLDGFGLLTRDGRDGGQGEASRGTAVSRHKVASRASATAGRCQHLAGKTSNAKGSTLQYFSIPRITTLADRRHRHPAVLSGLSRLTACPADAFLPSRCRLWAGGSGFRPLLFLHTSRRLLLHLPVPRHARFRLSPQLRVWLVARSGKQTRRARPSPTRADATEAGGPRHTPCEAAREA